MTLRRYLTMLIWWCVLPLFVLAAVLASWHVWAVQQRRDEEAQRLAASAAATVDRALRARLDGLDLLARSPLAARTDDPGDLEAWYREAQAYRQTYDSHVLLAATDRRILMHTNVPLGDALPALPRPEGRSAFEDALATMGPAVGDLFHGPTLDEPLVAAATPVLRPGREPLVLLSVAGARHFARHLAEIALPEGAGLVLRDGGGSAIARVGVAAGPGSLRFTAPLAQARWSTELTLPRGAFIGAAATLAVALALTVLATTLVGVVGGLWASRRLATAVRSLAGGSEGNVADSSSLGRRSAPPPAIAEIESARSALHDAAAARARAERARRDSDEQYRRRIEQATLALQTSEAMLRGVFESASEAIVTANAAQFIVMANPAAGRVFRCAQADLVGRPLASLLPEQHRRNHEEQVRRFGHGDDRARRMRPELVEGLRADGEIFPAEVAISHVHVEGRELFTAVVRDVTERQRADAELRASKATLETALASMNDAVCIADAQGRTIEFNEAFVRFYRFGSRAECQRHLAELPALIELLQPDGTTAAGGCWPVQRALRGETATLVNCRLRRADSGACWAGSYSFAPIRAGDGRIAGAVVTVRDVTELHEAEAELAASHEALQRLVSAQDSVQEAERRRIARELHDDLQQTLAAVTMEVALLRRHGAADAPMAEGLARIGALAAAGIDATRRIVNDLQPQLLEELGLAAALEALAAQFERTSGVACAFAADLGGLGSLGEATLPTALATCLYRVAQEALNNVAKHAGARQARVALACDTPAARLRLRIEDDGRGFAPDDWRQPGALGLLGMHERVRAVGGTLRVAATPAGGTTVEVVVALDPGAAPAPAAEHQE